MRLFIATSKRMAILKTKSSASKKATKKTEEKVVPQVVGAATSTSAAKAARFAHLLVSPRVSEKAAMLASKGVYVFNVPVSANKVEVKKAVEAKYNVKVDSVNTVRGPGKIVRRGGTAGVRNMWKKALVTLTNGQKIDIYEGV